MLAAWVRGALALALISPCMSCALIDAAGDPEPESACLDGRDDDGNGLQDCEDPACRGEPICGDLLAFTGERCDGVDDAGSSLAGVIDEGACACVNDDGCDDFGADFRCDKSFIVNPNIDGSGTCMPDCRLTDYCTDMPEFQCGTDGFCDFVGPT